MSVTVQQSVVLFTDTKISDCRAVTLLLFSVTLLLLYQFHDIIASRKFQIIISAAQLHHSVNASSGAFHDIFRKEDFFPALSFQAVVDVH